MKNYYEILGLTKDASDDDIKKAYRKLASKHHPDKGGDKAAFQEMKEAYEILSDPSKRRQYDNPQPDVNYSDIESILREMRKHGSPFANFRQVHAFVTNTTLAAASKGFRLKVQIDGADEFIKIPAGVPHEAHGQYKTEAGKDVQVTVRIVDPPFAPISINEAPKVISPDGQRFTGEIATGPLLMPIEVDAIDLILGAWVNIKGFDGEELTVRIPAGHQPQNRLKVKGKGYVNWDVSKGEASKVRSDLFLAVRPTFKAPKDIEFAKIEALYNLTKPKK